jgi:hypothetical protein
MNGSYSEITNISSLAKLFFKTFISLKHLSNYRTVGLSDYSYGPYKNWWNIVKQISGIKGSDMSNARQNTGLLWHTAVCPSIHTSYDNISHLFPLLLIGHVVTYIVLIKGGASERCDFSQFGN